MLFAIYPELKNNRILSEIRDYFSSIWYTVTVGVIVTLSALFGGEIYCLYLVLLLLFAGTLLAKSTLVYAPVAVMVYMMVSLDQNIGSNPESVFSDKEFISQMSIIIILLAVFMVVRFCHDFTIKRINEMNNGETKVKVPALTYGFLALGIAYVLGGLFSGKFNVRLDGYYPNRTSYSGKTALFGLVEILSLSFFYFYFYFSVDRKDIDYEYITQLLCVVGFVVGIQVIGEYIHILSSGDLGEFSRGKIEFGWGCYNNIGGVLAVCVCAPLYYVVKDKKPILFLLMSTLFLVFIILSQSRGSIVCGCAVYGLGLLYAFIKCKKEFRINIVIVLLVELFLVICVCLIFRDKVKELFESLIEIGTNDNSRIGDYWIPGLKQFRANAIFGNGFYECPKYDLYGELLDNPGGFLPPRYHNIIIQILACCGIVGFAAFCFHMFQVAMLHLKDNNIQSMFILLSILGLLSTSLLDNHFFNFGPGILYSISLLFAEFNREKVKQEKSSLVENKVENQIDSEENLSVSENLCGENQSAENKGIENLQRENLTI